MVKQIFRTAESLRGQKRCMITQLEENAKMQLYCAACLSFKIELATIKKTKDSIQMVFICNECRSLIPVEINKNLEINQNKECAKRAKKINLEARERYFGKGKVEDMEPNVGGLGLS